MKKIKTILAMAFVAMLPLTFTACDDDDDWNDNYYPTDNPDSSSDDAVDMARMLNGHWTGTLVAQGYDSNNILQKITYSTDIEFMQKNNDINATEGRGLQNDYIDDKLDCSRHFAWSINGKSGDITIVYDATDDAAAYTMVIDYDDLSLSETQFTGEMVGNGETDSFNFKWYSLAKKNTVTEE